MIKWKKESMQEKMRTERGIKRDTESNTARERENRCAGSNRNRSTLLMNAYDLGMGVGSVGFGVRGTGYGVRGAGYGTPCNTKRFSSAQLPSQLPADSEKPEKRQAQTPIESGGLARSKIVNMIIIATGGGGPHNMIRGGRGTDPEPGWTLPVATCGM